jgi:hypothetical protein
MVMTQRILVRGELTAWVHAGRAISIVGAVAGLCIVAWGRSWGFLLAGGSTVMWLVLEQLAWQARRIRTWLTLHPDGIEIESRDGHRAIHDSQISAVALETKKNLANGELSSITRKFTIWIAEEPGPIRMQNKIKTGKEDPLAGLIERLLTRLGAKLEGELARGGTASGDDWHLSRTALTVGRAPDDEQIPLSAVTAVEPSDGKMCIWRSGQDTAVARLPLSGRNVHLLPALVRPFLAAPGAQTEFSTSTVSLGRVLFERRAQRSTVLAVSIAGLMMTVCGVALLISFWGQVNADEGLFVAAGVLLVLGPGLAAVGWWLAGTCFRCHERGVWKATPLAQKTLRYDEVGAFQYSAVRHYHNGAYIGTQLTMRFTPLPAQRRSTIKVSTRIRGEDDDLDRLRDMISQRMAARMLEHFQTGQAVSWTANLQFLPDGIWYRPAGFVGRKQPQVLSYSDYGGHDLKDGTFYLFARGCKKAVTSESAAADNFFPGYCLLLVLLHAEAASLGGSESGAAVESPGAAV